MSSANLVVLTVYVTNNSCLQAQAGNQAGGRAPRCCTWCAVKEQMILRSLLTRSLFLFLTNLDTLQSAVFDLKASFYVMFAQLVDSFVIQFVHTPFAAKTSTTLTSLSLIALSFLHFLHLQFFSVLFENCRKILLTCPSDKKTNSSFC